MTGEIVERLWCERCHGMKVVVEVFDDAFISGRSHGRWTDETPMTVSRLECDHHRARWGATTRHWD